MPTHHHLTVEAARCQKQRKKRYARLSRASSPAPESPPRRRADRCGPSVSPLGAAVWSAVRVAHARGPYSAAFRARGRPRSAALSLAPSHRLGGRVPIRSRVGRDCPCFRAVQSSALRTVRIVVDSPFADLFERVLSSIVCPSCSVHVPAAGAVPSRSPLSVSYPPALCVLVVPVS